MKKLILVALVFVTSFTLLSNSVVSEDTLGIESVNDSYELALENNFLEKFPAYIASMDLDVDCSASCVFSSCSGSGQCVCSCSWFSCKCKWRKPLTYGEIEGIGISMNETQYKNTRVLGSVLKSLDEPNADSAYGYLVTMIKSIKAKDQQSLEKSRDNFIDELNLISDAGKEELNSLFVILKAEMRV